MDNNLNIIEALLFASGEAVSVSAIAKAMCIKDSEARRYLNELKDYYDSEKRGLSIVKMENTYQLTTRMDYFESIKNFVNINTSNALSQASLETLSIIAYRQPITRGEIEDIRGVKSSSSIELLLDRGLICESGRKEAVGRPALFSTTNEFLKLINVESVKDLPDYESFYNDIQLVFEEAETL